MSTWLEDHSTSTDRGGFIHRYPDRVRIGTHTYHTPQASGSHRAGDEAFAAFCLDEPSAKILNFVAVALDRGESPLLLGPTSASKSWGAALAGHLLGYPVSRLALSASTESADLIGRYVPSSGDWIWIDGPVARAARNGGLVILDEMNLPVSSVTERINGLLDEPPWLTLAESTGESLGLGGLPVNSRCRLVGTANPISYAARERLSEAFISRWSTLRVPAPSEAAFNHQLTFLLLGIQPGLGDRASTRHEPPLGGRLLEVDWAPELIKRLARFTSGMAAATRAGDDGTAARIGRPGEPVVIGRRTVSRLARALAAADPASLPQACTEAIEHYFFSPLRERERDLASKILTAAGLQRVDLEAMACSAKPGASETPTLSTRPDTSAAILVTTQKLSEVQRSHLACLQLASLPEDIDAPWVLGIHRSLAEAEGIARSIDGFNITTEIVLLENLGGMAVRWSPAATPHTAVSAVLLDAARLPLSAARSVAHAGHLQGQNEETAARVRAALSTLDIDAELIPPCGGEPYLRVACPGKGPQRRVVASLLGCSPAEAAEAISTGKLLQGASLSVLRATAAFLRQRSLGFTVEVIQ